MVNKPDRSKLFTNQIEAKGSDDFEITKTPNEQDRSHNAYLNVTEWGTG